MDEFARIRSWTAGRQSAAWLRERGVALGIGDDAALLEAPAGEDGRALQWVAAVDTMVETVHFNDVTMTDEDIGYKALAANISDIAAMGGVPRHALVSVSVPPAWEPERVRRVYDGLYACAELHGVAVVGGDTTSAPAHLVLAVTVLGTVEAGRALTRAGARPGDALFVTGPVGLSAAGLHGLGAGGPAWADGAEGAALARAHRRPAPSVKAGRLLAASGVCTSLNDVSDGLASEAWELAEASGAAVVLRERELPRSGSLLAYAARVASGAGARRREPAAIALDWMLHGGEDYVLVGTAQAQAAAQLKERFRAEGLPFYIIGAIEDGEPAVWLEGTSGPGRKRPPRMALEKKGYNHFTAH